MRYDDSGGRFRTAPTLMPSWFNFNLAAAVAIISAVLAAYRAHLSARHDISDLTARVKSLEDAGAEREATLREEIRRELAGEVKVLSVKLESHAQEDSRMAADIGEIRATITNVWATLGRVDKSLSAVLAKLEK